MKKSIQLIILFITALVFSNHVIANEISVKIKLVNKITTSNLGLQEGDTLDFFVSEDVLVNEKKYLEKGQKVTGTVTSIEENNYLIQPAHLYIENFKTTNVKNESIKLKGIVYKKGNAHEVLGEFVILDIIRGGEVQIKPEKDEFTIYLEENL